jgi:hypothetical protein
MASGPKRVWDFDEEHRAFLSYISGLKMRDLVIKYSPVAGSQASVLGKEEVLTQALCPRLDQSFEAARSRIEYRVPTASTCQGIGSRPPSSFLTRFLS